ncbi:hypothetical protein OC861_006546 [Tilletia horrida]|nr:hypothetical protein OC845_003185 [Tilletia horrida]KAK0559750.1 hypothetical protein OC861_006546 [Tilletia horrida]
MTDTYTHTGPARASRAADPQPPPSRGYSWSQLLDTGSQGLSLATAATSAGFSTAKFFTSTGLEIAKKATQFSLSLPAYAYDLASADQDGTAARSMHTLVGSVFDGVSMLALGAVDLSGNITAAALGAATTGLTSINSAISSELARSLASFSRLVQRNWNHVDESLPPGGIPQYSIIQITRALTAWVSIQLVTRPMHEQRVLSGLDEIDIDKISAEVKTLKTADLQERQTANAQAPGSAPIDNKPRITSETRIDGDGGDIITAEIGHSNASAAPSVAQPPLTVTKEISDNPDDQPLTPAQTLLGFGRYSRLVLGIYGGMALRYLGVDIPRPARADEQDTTAAAAGVAPPPEVDPSPPQDHDTELKHDEEDFLAGAAALDLRETYAEAEASGLIPGAWRPEADGSDRVKFVLEPEDIYGSTAVERDHPTPGFVTPRSGPSSQPASGDATPSFNVLDHDQRPPAAYSLIDLISGKHDDDIFHQMAGTRRDTAEAGQYTSTAYNPTGRPVPSRPKFYVVTDHAAKKVVLVLRGTLSFGDVAADLTCDAVPFENMDVRLSKPRPPSGEDLPDGAPSNGQHHDDDNAYMVHEGMYHTALSVGGSREAPVHRAVARALAQNQEYDLDITGHSLGAGLAALLALLWVGVPDNKTSIVRGRTSDASGLPAGRKVHAYCFGVPCVMSAPLGRRCVPFISSWAHSWDIVCRFSLGHVLDIRNACAWLAYEERISQPAAPQRRRRTGRSSRRKTRRGTAEEGQQNSLEEVDDAAAAVASDAADALTDRGESVAPSMSSNSTEIGEGDEEEDAEEDDTTEQHRRDPDSPPFDITNLIKQAFAHIASTPRQGAPANNSGPPQPTFDWTTSSTYNAQSVYNTAASFIGRASQARFPSTEEELAARRRTEEVFWSLRRTLEANMRHVELYPPGDVLITFEDGDLLRPTMHRSFEGGQRLFHLRDSKGRGNGKRHDVFGQIEFRTGFLARHMPHRYAQQLQAVLDP